MVELRVLDGAEIATYCADFVTAYALDLAENHGMTPAAAKAKAQGDVDSCFTDGQVAPGQNPMAVVLGGELVGYLWYELQSDGSVAYVNDFEIRPAFRGRGLAKAAMAALESRVRGEGVAQIKLRVAADNPVARHVYDAGGFRVSGVNMYKSVG